MQKKIAPGAGRPNDGMRYQFCLCICYRGTLYCDQSLWHEQRAIWTCQLLPPIGLACGSVTASRLAKHYALRRIILSGILLGGLGVIFMLIAMLLHLHIILSLFMPMVLIYFGQSPVMANAPTIALSHVSDKAHGSAVMSFINMGLATVVTLSLGLLPLNPVLLPMIYLGLIVFMLAMFKVYN